MNRGTARMAKEQGGWKMKHRYRKGEMDRNEIIMIREGLIHDKVDGINPMGRC